jgi:magnesium transporter
MIRSLYLTHAGELRADMPPEGIAAALEDKQGVMWVDVVGEPPETAEPLFRDVFHFHPLAIADALYQEHTPKLDDWGDYVLAVLSAIGVEGEGEGLAGVDATELDTFLGANFFVSYSKVPIPAVARVWERCLRDDRHLKEGPDHILYRVADELAEEAIAVVDQMREAIDGVEEVLFDKPTREMIEQIFGLRRMVLQVRRMLWPQRDVIGRLSRDDFPMIDAYDRAYFRDVFDHLVRLDYINENLRDLLSGALDTYLSLVNNRMNEAMRTLAVITALFMPISFLAGFFGMNFFGPFVRLETWTGVPSLAATLALMVLLPVLMYWWIRRRGWM